MARTWTILAVVGGLLCCVVMMVLVLVFMFKDGGSEINPNLTNQSTDTSKFVAGTQTDGKKIYACLANFDSSVTGLVGKTWDGYNKCDVTWGGKVNNAKDYKVATPMKPYAWVPRARVEANNGMHTRVAGFPSDGPNGQFTSYVCRADMGGGYKHTGRTYFDPGTSAGTCWVADSSGKKELTFPSYEYAVYTS